MGSKFENTIKNIIQELPPRYLQDVSTVEKNNYTFTNLTDNKSIGLWYDKELYYLDEYEHSKIKKTEIFETEKELLTYIKNNY